MCVCVCAASVLCVSSLLAGKPASAVVAACMHLAAPLRHTAATRYSWHPAAKGATHPHGVLHARFVAPRLQRDGQAGVEGAVGAQLELAAHQVAQVLGHTLQGQAELEGWGQG